MTIDLLIGASGLAATALFVYGIKRMSSPATAHLGMKIAGAGMLVAILASFLYVFGVNEAARPRLGTNVVLAAAALAIGLGWAWWSGKRVAITAMPQMVALYNGMGGGAAGAIAAAELAQPHGGGALSLAVTIVGGLIGSVSLSGSLIAWAKLDGRLNKPWRVKGQQWINGAVLLSALGLGAALIARSAAGTAGGGDAPAMTAAIVLFFGAALAFGVMMTLPIGGADMPVVISLYNAFTGLAVGLEGFVLQNPALMVAGMVVGSAGTLLTLLMAKAMNRSVANVLFSNFGDVSLEASSEIKGRLKPVEASDAALSMRYAGKVIIAPGYGLAAAQAQQKLAEFVTLLQASGVEVKFAIHPVAGRMPGHMDVLLAEAGVPYDLLFELSEINDEFKTADVALVIGANDVVNPAARSNKTSPIYGMPILNVDQAHQVYVIKRGEGRGYAGVENELFYADNCNMIYGDARAVLAKMAQTIKELETSASPAGAAA
ncbi:NAD(P)(+) transhydrogenase (Re/Si-specific) subunit beta [Trinickia caryophylli]|uniref:NAD(P) transhydrogenase subunit beta n=1 Tax=Trinickia caryophylli TaxID=28094 RepID=A0A1X7F5X4_TRICW|nr:NAD(P)(+) transhydrogenase (Re/Si-specific) subunit beta [Trinickia caryophylli]PMS09275.1 NAD(P) transhydrogenase subunit beta [Trinickia caryophylli]TRX19363.1 NAD(P)(+) transhydrogenase (Re/Si-specific) subunit beta [Trinickia caryophylli]WQE13329.1 NAD(P)(+) transhydrogenase (Re/Si-specific) subunit beta [Trinickia caryophylli]SMF46532.1 NAD(P) transhydrogenase subunit beta [Trinickia caryophylli]GLU35806.1 NAD(P) transhydrogenase subunit beta [Trinickia caryophylli]